MESVLEAVLLPLLKAYPHKWAELAHTRMSMSIDVTAG